MKNKMTDVLFYSNDLCQSYSGTSTFHSKFSEKAKKSLFINIFSQICHFNYISLSEKYISTYILMDVELFVIDRESFPPDKKLFPPNKDFLTVKERLLIEKAQLPLAR